MEGVTVRPDRQLCFISQFMQNAEYIFFVAIILYLCIYIYIYIYRIYSFVENILHLFGLRYDGKEIYYTVLRHNVLLVRC